MAQLPPPPHHEVCQGFGGRPNPPVAQCGLPCDRGRAPPRTALPLASNPRLPLGAPEPTAPVAAAPAVSRLQVPAWGASGGDEHPGWTKSWHRGCVFFGLFHLGLLFVVTLPGFLLRKIAPLPPRGCYGQAGGWGFFDPPARVVGFWGG